MRIVDITKSEALVSNINSFSRLYIIRIPNVIRRRLSSLKASLYSSLKANGVSFLVRFVSGAITFLKLLINLR